MKFVSGSDLWINLVKVIVLSFISVMIFLPALTLLLYPLIEKTSHKQWLPTKYNVGKYILKLRFPALILIAIIIVPAFFAQSNTSFIYVMCDIPDDSSEVHDMIQIEEAFYIYTQL